jgi:hypothetical protein
MKLINEAEISKEVRLLRKHLTPLLSEHYIDILKEVEKRLTIGEVQTISTPIKHKKIQNKRRTKKEFYAMLFNK